MRSRERIKFAGKERANPPANCALPELTYIKHLS
jgi:hypothetical protein